MTELEAKKRLEVTFELMSAGIALYREQLQRSFPKESDKEIEKRLRQFLLNRNPPIHE